MKDMNSSELEKRNEDLIKDFKNLISQPVNEKSINDAETIGVDMIAELVSNTIMLDVINYDNDEKLSKTALKIKYGINDDTKK